MMLKRYTYRSLLLSLCLVCSCLSDTTIAQVGRWFALEGDGTGALFVSKSDKTAYLIDGGRAGDRGIQSFTMTLEDGRQAGVLEWLYTIGVRRLSIACSHSHADHTGALARIVASDPWMVAFDEVIFIDSGFQARPESPIPSLSAVYVANRKDLRVKAATIGIRPSPLQTEPITRNGTDTELYAELAASTANVVMRNIKYTPDEAVAPHGHAIVHLIQLQASRPDGTKHNTILLEPDDATTEVLSRVAAQLKSEGIHLDVVSMPHHGSRNPGPGPLLDKALWPERNGRKQPPFVVISANVNNQYGHPHASTLIECLRAVGWSNVRITGATGDVEVRAGERPRSVTLDESREQYLRVVRPSSIKVAQDLQSAESDLSQAERLYCFAADSLLLAPADGPEHDECVERADIAAALLEMATERVEALMWRRSEYRNLMSLMYTPLSGQHALEAADLLPVAATESKAIAPDDPRWIEARPISVESWQAPARRSGQRSGAPSFDRLVKQTSLQLNPSQEDEPKQISPAEARRRRLDATKQKRPKWGGITLGGVLDGQGWVPTGAIVEVHGRFALITLRVERSGVAAVAQYGPVSIDDLWSATQFVSPDATMSSSTVARAGEVGLTAGTSDSSGACLFALHPAIEQAAIGFDAMRLDHSVYALYLRTQQSQFPNVLAPFQNLELFDGPGWAYHWFDEPMSLNVRDGHADIMPREDSKTTVLSLRFWRGDDQAGAAVPCPPEIVKVVQEQCDAFTRLDRFARLVALCHWLNDAGLVVRGAGAISPRPIELDLRLEPWEVAPHLWDSSK